MILWPSPFFWSAKAIICQHIWQVWHACRLNLIMCPCYAHKCSVLSFSSQICDQIKGGTFVTRNPKFTFSMTCWIYSSYFCKIKSVGCLTTPKCLCLWLRTVAWKIELLLCLVWFIVPYINKCVSSSIFKIPNSDNLCFLVHNIVRNFTADYDKTLIFNKIHHELNQVYNYIKK